MNSPRDSFRNCHRVVPVALLILILATGCKPPEKPKSDAVRPVKTMVVTAGGETHERLFPGKVEASKKVELAFQVPGLLANFPVRAGQTVKKGELIAQLRQDEFQARLKTLQGQLDQARATLRGLQAGVRPEERLRLEGQVRAAEARLANARSELDRNERLVRTGAASRADYETTQTNFKVAQEDLKAAQQMLEKGVMAREEDLDAQEAQVRGIEGRVVEAKLHLEDSTLHAPYDGVIAQRFVEPNQNITARQPIVKFQDVDEIEVAVDVPETVMMTDLRSADIVQLLATFSGAPGIQFPVHIIEIAQRADPVTQTFKVRVAMKVPPDVNLLPGMTASVRVTYRRASVLGNQILVPISSVYKESSGEQVVWAIGPDQVVSRRAVKLGEATAGKIELKSGVQPGDRIAVAGVTFLREGMKVKDLGNAFGGGQ